MIFCGVAEALAGRLGEVHADNENCISLGMKLALEIAGRPQPLGGLCLFHIATGVGHVGAVDVPDHSFDIG
ncbi:hypothetical protein D3C78_1978600 [compost metagenome]